MNANIFKIQIICVNYLKLLSELRGVALRVNLQHLLIGECKFINRDGSLSTQTSLQDGIMDEHILLLRDKPQGKHPQIYSHTKACTYEPSNC